MNILKRFKNKANFVLRGEDGKGEDGASFMEWLIIAVVAVIIAVGFFNYGDKVEENMEGTSEVVESWTDTIKTKGKYN